MNFKLVKVCGMRNAENIREVEILGIDWMGFIFAPKSSRYICERPVYLPKGCKRVGVFVDADITEVMVHVNDFRLDLVQLHGHESPDYIRQLRDAYADGGQSASASCKSKVTEGRCGVGIIKVFSIATPEDLSKTSAYEGIADYFLFDTKGKLPGGNGTQFDWDVLRHYHGTTPFLLSGGIGPDDAERIKAFSHSRCIGIDLNSRFESAPAFKDVHLLREFIKKIKDYE